MKKYIIIFLSVLTISLSAQNNIILSPQDSAQILEKAGLKVMFLEASMNYIADPYTKSKDVIQKNAYALDFDDRLFLNENVLIEDDLSPFKIASAERPEFMSASAYLQQFRETYKTTDPKSVTFRASKIRYLGRTPKSLFAEIFFESTYGGISTVDTSVVFQKTYRLATCAVERVGEDWKCYIKEIKFADDNHIRFYVPQEYLDHKEELKRLEKEGKN
jgi:hypothetical protein